MGSKLLQVVGGVVVAVVAAALLLGTARFLLYRQADDPAHLTAKQEYLEQVARSGRGPVPPPNVVLILFDDLGAGDLAVYGGRGILTPNLDRLAREGVRMVEAYSASPYCSASRAALLTGRYAARSGMDHVLQAPGSWMDLLLRLGWRNRRLPAEEVTLPEVLTAAGYAAGMFGKWHLGAQPPSRPNDRGFEPFYGLLFSNDQGRPVVWRNDLVVEPHPIDQSTLTRRYTEEAVTFIEEHRGRPFFLYLPHTFPHVPLHVSRERLGSSSAGLYGDVVEELDWSVGTILRALDRFDLAASTLVVITSDNGPWFQGSPAGLRGRKMDVFEGGLRVPFLVRYPGRIAAGRVIDSPVMGIDVFPTVLELTGIPLPADRVIDGVSLTPVLDGSGELDREALFYYQLGALRAVRAGRFKYHARHRVLYGNPMDWPWAPMKRRGPWLFDLELDPEESWDVAQRHPKEARRLRRLLEQRQQEDAANPAGWIDPRRGQARPRPADRRGS